MIGPAPATSIASPAGLESSYYYAAVAAGEQKLPVAPPPKIPLRPSVDASQGEAELQVAASAGCEGLTRMASGTVREDLDRKGQDSYYYAHDRTTQFVVPTVPKRLHPDGSMTPWDGK